MFYPFINLYNRKACKTIGLFPVSIFCDDVLGCVCVCQCYNSKSVWKTSLNAPKSINICVGGSANLVAVFIEENHEIISMFLVEIEFMILVFWCPQTVYFVGPLGTEIWGVLVDFEYVESLWNFRKEREIN